MNKNIEQLLQLPNTWQASRGPRQAHGIATGYDALDTALHLGGWPPGATTELLLPRPGIGEWRLLLPTLQRLQQQSPWLVLIDPPWQPFAPALQRFGIDLQRLLIIRPGGLREFLWTTDECLRSASCSTVLSWASDKPLRDKELRRLQQAAVAGGCWHVLLRHQREQQQTSPAALRLVLSPQQNGQLPIQILKQRGGWADQTLSLELIGDPARPFQEELARRTHQQPSHHAPLPDLAALGQRGSQRQSGKVTALSAART